MLNGMHRLLVISSVFSSICNHLPAAIKLCVCVDEILVAQTVSIFGLADLVVGWV